MTPTTILTILLLYTIYFTTILEVLEVLKILEVLKRGNGRPTDKATNDRQSDRTILLDPTEQVLSEPNQSEGKKQRF